MSSQNNSNSNAPSQTNVYTQSKILRSDFPKDFIFGSATSAYQVEGAWAKDGKGLSNWDAFTLRTPGKITGGANGCVAIDQYSSSKEDVALLKRVGLDSYRFSIAWSRVLPGGRLAAGVNREGIKYYNDLIDLLLAHGITPSVTLFHWDIPQCLEDEYGGFLSTRIVKDFCEFAELCFWEFGDRVKHWVTQNEPWSFTVQGYVVGTFPPGRGPTTEQSEYQGGKIGVTNMCQWYEPLTNTTADKDAASRGLDFLLGWFVAPIVTGDYPASMRQLVGDRLPTFTPEQVKLVKGSYDFLGINYYTAVYASNSPTPPGTTPNYFTDQNILTSTERDGVPIGPKAGSDWLYIVPYGIHKLLVEIKRLYNSPTIYITENGVDEVNNTALTFSEARFDEMRINYHQDHLFYVKKAMDEGVDVKGYYVWSMFDNFEWGAGYSVRFGLFYVDFVNGHLTRFPKASAIWLTNFLNKKQGTLKRQAQEEEVAPVKRLRSSAVKN